MNVTRKYDEIVAKNRENHNQMKKSEQFCKTFQVDVRIIWDRKTLIKGTMRILFMLKLRGRSKTQEKQNLYKNKYRLKESKRPGFSLTKISRYYLRLRKLRQFLSTS